MNRLAKRRITSLLYSVHPFIITSWLKVGSISLKLLVRHGLLRVLSHSMQLHQNFVQEELCRLTFDWSDWLISWSVLMTMFVCYVCRFPVSTTWSVSCRRSLYWMSRFSISLNLTMATRYGMLSIARHWLVVHCTVTTVQPTQAFVYLTNSNAVAVSSSTCMWLSTVQWNTSEQLDILINCVVSLSYQNNYICSYFWAT